jgi:uncharacterized protein YbbK (DUF523 family)
MSTDLQTRFEAALRRELGMAGDAPPGAAVVNVQPAAVNISPEIRATLPMPSEPVEVVDIGRQNGAYEFRMRVTRNAQGQITDAVVSPEKFIPLESFT